MNRQRSTRVGTGFEVELGIPQPRLTYSRFGELPPDSYYWQLPPPYQGDKVMGCPPSPPQGTGVPTGAPSLAPAAPTPHGHPWLLTLWLQ